MNCFCYAYSKICKGELTHWNFIVVSINMNEFNILGIFFPPAFFLVIQHLLFMRIPKYIFFSEKGTHPLVRSMSDTRDVRSDFFFHTTTETQLASCFFFLRVKLASCLVGYNHTK